MEKSNKKGDWGKLTGAALGSFFGPWGATGGGVLGSVIDQMFQDDDQAYRAPKRQMLRRLLLPQHGQALPPWQNTTPPRTSLTRMQPDHYDQKRRAALRLAGGYS
tara:strand:- start:2204 stop:2518 length:315 start_codon:yes stop_codon:yes gene_type:complete